MKEQWSSFLENLGEWEGYFTRFSPTGELLAENQSLLSLIGLNNNTSARLTLKRFTPNPQGGEPEVNELVREYENFGRDILFFENGAFCQGSIQLAPFTELGAEFGFINTDRRLRLVELFDVEGKPKSLTVVTEKRVGTNAIISPPLTVDHLLGKWEGEAITIYPDFRPSDSYSTELIIEKQGSDRLIQELNFSSNDQTKTMKSTARIDGKILHFEENNQPIQVILLPGGASATIPLKIDHHQPTFFEGGWLIEPDLRQRMIRSYNNRGEWISLTLVTERLKK